MFLDSETSVLPARRSRRVAAASARGRTTRSSRSGGTRTLTTSIKSRVRLPIALRTRDHAPRIYGLGAGGSSNMCV